MWWRSSVAGLALVGLASLGLSACGFRPLYGTTASGQSMAEVLKGVKVTPIPGRVGQRVRNQLIFTNTGGGDPGPTKYTLDITIKESLTQEMVRISGDPTGEVYQLNATFRLKGPDGKVVVEGSALGRAAFDRFQQTFANVRADYDAQDRAADAVAESIRARIAAYLQSQA